MLRPNVLVTEAIGFFCRVGQDALAGGGQREIDRNRVRRTFAEALLDAIAKHSNSDGPLKILGEDCCAFSQQAEEEVLGFDLRRSELARFIAGLEDDASRWFGVALKHGSILSRKRSSFDSTRSPRRAAPLRGTTPPIGSHTGQKKSRSFDCAQDDNAKKQKCRSFDCALRASLRMTTQKGKARRGRAFGAISTLSSGYLVQGDFLSGFLAGKLRGILGNTKVRLDGKGEGVGDRGRV